MKKKNVTMKQIPLWTLGAGWWRTVVVLLCGLPLVLCGCDGDTTAAEIGPTLFEFDRHLVAYTAVDTYPWDTTLRQALATTSIQNFTGGNATIRIYDGIGNAVYTRLAVASSVSNFVPANAYTVSELTQSGMAGKWQVELSLEQFTGDLHVRLEQP